MIPITTALSDKNKRIYLFIRFFINENGYAPSRRDIVAAIEDVTSTSMANYSLKQLESSGYIRMSPNIARAITLTNKDAAWMS